jgi:hypothetical protein
LFSKFYLVKPQTCAFKIEDFNKPLSMRSQAAHTACAAYAFKIENLLRLVP